MGQKTYNFLSINYKSISNTLHAFYPDTSVYQSSLWLSQCMNEQWGKYSKCYHNWISMNTEDVGYKRNFTFRKGLQLETLEFLVVVL